MNILFCVLPSYFQCRSLLKSLILMGVENSMIPYGRLEMNYYFCLSHSTETFFVELIVCYCVSKKTIITIIYLLWRENCQTSMRLLCLFACLYKHKSKYTRKKESFG